MQHLNTFTNIGNTSDERWGWYWVGGHQSPYMTWGWAEPQGRRHKFAANQWHIVQISGALYQGGARWGRRRGGDGGTVFCLFMEQSFTSPDTPPNLYPEGFQGNFIPVDAAAVGRLCVDRLTLSFEKDD
ncbi:hypothetical protein C8R47DRAFT_1084309 [Mycena vitilis]|nr:hypothetical protein C8R47DRAFT_1084309 [Mycena vitilis]